MKQPVFVCSHCGNSMAASLEAWRCPDCGGPFELDPEPLDPSAEPVVGDDENTEAGWFPVSQMPVTDPKWRLAIGDAAAQRRHPGSFAPRMGLSKR